MKILVRSKVTDSEVYLFSFTDLFTSEGQLIVTDIDSMKFYFSLEDYDFLVFFN